ncbi:MAG: transglycosylase domain-containing protein [Caulobacteraceae bacterium]
MLSVIAVAGFSLAIYAAWLFHGMPDASDLADYRPPTATRVFAWDGTLIGEFSRERRIYVPYDQIPPKLSEAFLAAEDHNFFKHQGIDVGGLGRAMLKNLLNAMRGKRFEGGSTITQQVAKNVLLGNQATLGRKLKEAILARRLEQTLSKEQILDLYLNEIWLGYRSYGVAAAAYNYFGKSLQDLDLAQMAYLAALPKGPDNYQPITRKAAAIGRRNWIIKQMMDLGWVSRAEGEEAMREDLKVQLAPERAHYRDADYFVEEVRQEALSTLGQKLNEGGYYLRTTLDPRLQTIARVAPDARPGGLRPPPRLARRLGPCRYAGQLGAGDQGPDPAVRAPRLARRRGGVRRGGRGARSGSPGAGPGRWSPPTPPGPRPARACTAATWCSSSRPTAAATTCARSRR